mmetsp:Transcript_31277/g.110088  ORF Transcript_31277/g.110088 Transcript_31277/m.110088 type:complete len:228 (+) Transcript_31277:445-1128(+)
MAPKSATSSTPAVAKAQATFVSSSGLKVSTDLPTANATPRKSSGAAKPAVAKAHAVFASDCGSQSASLPRVSASMALKSLGAGMFAVAKDQARFDRFCVESSQALNDAASAMLSKSRRIPNSSGRSSVCPRPPSTTSSSMPAWAKAQAQFDKSCALNSPILGGDNRATQRNKPRCIIPAVAKAQTHVDTSCGFKGRVLHKSTNERARAWKRRGESIRAFAKAHARVA